MQADRKVIGEVVAADRNHRGMGYRALKEDNQFGGTSTNIDQAGAKFALIRRDGRFRGRNRFKDRVRYFEARLVRARDDALRRAGGTGGDMQIDFQPIADHPTGS